MIDAMKRKKGGRRKFSVGKELGTHKPIEENIIITTMGADGTEDRWRTLWTLIMSWNQPEYTAAALLRDYLKEDGLDDVRLREMASGLRPFLSILDDAFGPRDPKLIQHLARTVDAVRGFEENGPVSPLQNHILYIAWDEKLLTRDPKLTWKEFLVRVGGQHDERNLRRICKQLGIRFKSVRPGRPRKK
jgi:hypothetical protein